MNASETHTLVGRKEEIIFLHFFANVYFHRVTSKAMFQVINISYLPLVPPCITSGLPFPVQSLCPLQVGIKLLLFFSPCLGYGAKVIKAEPVEQLCHLGSFGYKEQRLTQLSQVTVCGYIVCVCVCVCVAI